MSASRRFNGVGLRRDFICHMLDVISIRVFKSLSVMITWVKSSWLVFELTDKFTHEMIFEDKTTRERHILRPQRRYWTENEDMEWEEKQE